MIWCPDFAAAAGRAKRAGFDAVEIHGAHGYLIAQFLSPFSNRRVDEYGAGIRGRTRFALEIVQRVRDVVGPDYPIQFRVSAEECGPGGLEAARVLAERGHRVHLFEEDEHLGGEFAVAVIVATGARPIRPRVPGADRALAVFAHDVLLGRRAIGERVLVIGAGPVGMEVAEFLAVQKKQVTIVEVTDRFGVGLEEGHLYWVMETLRDRGAVLINRASVEAIEADGTVRIIHDGRPSVLGPFDNVVLAAGYEPDDELVQQVRSKVSVVYVIGDAAKPRSAVEAIFEAAEVARTL